MYAVLFAFAILSLVLLPLVPKLLRLRVRFLRWLRWNWAADLIEKRFDGWVLFFRILLCVISAVLLVCGWRDIYE